MLNNNLILHADAKGDHPDVPVIFTSGSQPGKKGWFGGTIKDFEKKYPSAFSKNIQKNPKFKNAAKNDFTLAKGSEAVDAGAHLTMTLAAGNKTNVIKVQDARFFCDGFGLIKGDVIMVGKSLVRVTKVDIAANTITVAAPVTFNTGEFVDLPYSGKAPDIGAFEQNPPSLKAVN